MIDLECRLGQNNQGGQPVRPTHTQNMGDIMPNELGEDGRAEQGGGGEDLGDGQGERGDADEGAAREDLERDAGAERTLSRGLRRRHSRRKKPLTVRSRNTV